MNVAHVLEKLNTTELPLDYGGFVEILTLRRITYRGFAELEKEKGLLLPEFNLNSTKGQEMARVLIARAFEEYMEAAESDDPLHFLEEMIDFFNYASSLAIVDSRAPVEVFPRSMLLGWAYGAKLHQEGEPDDKLLFLAEAMAKVLETFRNRPWQNAPQSTVFQGWPEVGFYLQNATALTAIAFKADWAQFCRLFWAKNEVLLFRLRTKY